MSESVPVSDLRQMAKEMIDDLRSSGRVPGIAVGEHAPRFTLPAATGGTVSLEDRLSTGPVVLVFYRGAWCPACNAHLAALRTALPDLTAAGAHLIAISAQRPDDSLSFAQRLELGFDVLSDAEQAVIKAYRIAFELPASFHEAYRTMGMALDVHNADGSWGLPVPATFVIDTAGVVRFSHVDPDYRVRSVANDIVAVLARL